MHVLTVKQTQFANQNGQQLDLLIAISLTSHFNFYHNNNSQDQPEEDGFPLQSQVLPEVSPLIDSMPLMDFPVFANLWKKTRGRNRRGLCK